MDPRQRFSYRVASKLMCLGEVWPLVLAVFLLLSIGSCLVGSPSDDGASFWFMVSLVIVFNVLYFSVIPAARYVEKVERELAGGGPVVTESEPAESESKTALEEWSERKALEIGIGVMFAVFLSRVALVPSYLSWLKSFGTADNGSVQRLIPLAILVGALIVGVSRIEFKHRFIVCVVLFFGLILTGSHVVQAEREELKMEVLALCAEERHEEVVAHCSRQLEAGGERSWYLYYRGQCHLHLGHPEMAQKDLDSLASLDNESR